MVLVLCPLVGYSFLQAVRLYGEASRTALPYPDMARGLSPLDGLLTPAFGAYYLVATLLLPFVAIRMVGSERESGSIKLLLQGPFSSSQVVGTKVVALLLAAGVAWVPALCALGLWSWHGGHLHAGETANLILGHGLYAWAVLGISFFAASVAEAPATAAVVALAAVLGSWVLDFAAGTSAGWLKELSGLSLTSGLRPFERGLFSAPHALRLFLTGGAGLGLTALWLRTGNLRRRAVGTLLVLSAAVMLGIAGARPTFSWDMSENRRNSLNPAAERALRNMRKPLKITVHLAREDSRLRDLEGGMLGKLRRLVPRLTIVYAEEGNAGAWATSSDPEYGWLIYEYDGKTDRSTSNSKDEILPLLYGLSGQRVTLLPLAEYPGYPLAAKSNGWGLWFYLFLPIGVVLSAFLCRRGGLKTL
jgi:ABC-2 type transport system permease protein